MPTVTDKPETTTIQDPKFRDFLKSLTSGAEEEKTPDIYVVILHNDDITPFNVVTGCLQSVFKLPSDRAYQIMLAAHNTGQAEVAKMTEAEADEKIRQAREYAEGWDLRFSKEKE